MGKRYIRHSDLCGCERCARQWDTENPRPVFDAIEDPDILDCGCETGFCHCWDDDGRFDEPDDDEIAERGPSMSERFSANWSRHMQVGPAEGHHRLMATEVATAVNLLDAVRERATETQTEARL